MSIQAFDWIAKHAVAQPDAPAMHDLLSDRRYTYGEMNDRIDPVSYTHLTLPTTAYV